VRAVSLEVRAGEQVAVIGPSGAGKTTLLQLLACALQPTTGHLQLDGHRPLGLRRRALQGCAQRLFLAPQVPPLPPRQRVVTAVLAGRLPHEACGPACAACSTRKTSRWRTRCWPRLTWPTSCSSGWTASRAASASGWAWRAGAGVAGQSVAGGRAPVRAGPQRARALALASLTQAARTRGATLVATLHHVEMALAHFPRIVGLRDGTLAFDLPPPRSRPRICRRCMRSTWMS
jgi:phosphonate transport system ATP-binding protein